MLEIVNMAKITYTGLLHDKVTGLLKGSSSIMPLFLRSRGVGFTTNDN